MGSEDRVTELDVDGSMVYIIGVEDLILDRLRAGVYWNSTSDMEWARYLLESYIDDLDLAYLETDDSETVLAGIETKRESAAPAVPPGRRKRESIIARRFSTELQP